MRIPSRLAQQVRQRARNLCEYCRMPQAFYDTPHEPEHIISRQHAGKTHIDNLALACLHCNRHKGPNIAGIDPKTDTIVRLFNPRADKWDDHFEWDGPVILGKTDIGRATIAVLNMNDARLIPIRRSLINEGVFPPET